ncbi:MAG: T9SS type A sorting domain-containing protein, partial [Chitinophagales bacterium]
NGKLVVGGRAATVKNDFALVRYFSDPVVATCAAPVNPVTSAITSTSATLSWSNPANAASFQVRYRNTNDQNWTKLYVNATSVTLNGLTPSLKYVWNVKAKCDNGTSYYTTNTKFKTSAQRLEDATMELNGAMQVYPNPSSGNFQLSFNTGENATATGTIQIVNIFGQVVDSRTTNMVDGHLTETFQLSGELASGTYFVKLSVNNKMYSSRFVLQ